mmetsp:Transcript_79/g.176  ORF Transcript_79/g.176 Transcript_79/m.176 type:complete len:114 (-) Transcript_79:553-894(-)
MSTLSFRFLFVLVRPGTSAALLLNYEGETVVEDEESTGRFPWEDGHISLSLSFGHKKTIHRTATTKNSCLDGEERDDSRGRVVTQYDYLLSMRVVVWCVALSPSHLNCHHHWQ